MVFGEHATAFNELDEEYDRPHHGCGGRVEAGFCC